MNMDELIDFSSVVKSLPGRQLKPAACYRWATRGLRTIDGRVVRLRVVKIGRQFMTTRSCLEAFLAESAGVLGDAPPTPRRECGDGGCTCPPGDPALVMATNVPCQC